MASISISDLAIAARTLGARMAEAKRTGVVPDGGTVCGNCGDWLESGSSLKTHLMERHGYTEEQACDALFEFSMGEDL
ncbi:MAG: hypothetical protein AAF903_12160 [Pseudomonadota bacterium]